MNKFSMILCCGVISAMGMVAAETIDVNGSFERSKAMPDIHVKMLKEKGFELKFPKNKWIENWELNSAMNPATVSLLTEEAPDGKRFIRIASVKPTHFAQFSTLENRAYTITFMARGTGVTEDDNLYDPVVKVMVYTYVASANPKKWKGSVEFDTFDLEDKWKEYSVKIPAQFKDEAISLVFETTGQVDLDNIVVSVTE